MVAGRGISLAICPRPNRMSFVPRGFLFSLKRGVATAYSARFEEGRRDCFGKHPFGIVVCRRP